MRVLALNAGSSSIKASVVEAGAVVGAAANLQWGNHDRAATLAAALDEVLTRGGSVDAVAHRVVHGGPTITGHAVLDDAVVAAIEEVSDLAPLHNVPALETIRSARDTFGDLPQVACFDTAFHATLPPDVVRYPVPEAWHDHGIRRFGFHGLSVEWSVARAAELLGRPASELGLVVAHLGSGCSVTAVDGGRSAWTSMGYTPLDGIMMGTRPGALDPGIVVWVLRKLGLDAETVGEALDRDSGLRGVSGGRSDVRELEAAADGGDERARLALDMFVTRAAAGIAAAATFLRRLDGLVFTGGIGENAGRLRAGIVGRLGVLGVEPIDPAEDGRDRVIDSPSGPPVLRVAAREDIAMARAAERLLATR